MMQRSSTGGSAPELLAPAGNWDCVHAAIENGADAIYFGLESGFNARARAANFSLEDLPRLMQTLHRRGLSGFVTLNTLIFTDELSNFERHVARLADAGVDAVLVQDLGAVRLIHEICPTLSVHASTQMTMVSAETIAAIESLGIDRVVLARECSLDEIRKITSATSMPVETFVHGALCVAYSGQCLTSESLGGRSANRGQCAQACRLEYQLIRDGHDVDLGDTKYLLSPQDLAAYEQIPDLIQAGVCSLKIEGRLKTPEYVANIVRHYRQAIDAAMRGESTKMTPETQREMELSFSRGFSPGWLEGCNHKRLVPGQSSAKRGVLAGRVLRRKGERLVVELQIPLGKGDGIVLAGDRAAGKEVGGRIFQVYQLHRPVDQPVQGRVELEFQRGLMKDVEVYDGQAIWQTDAPQLTKRWRSTFASERFERRVPIRLTGTIEVGQPIQLRVEWHESREGLDSSEHHIEIQHPYIPEAARKHALQQAEVLKQLGRLGNTPYFLGPSEISIVGDPMVPLSVMGELRKRIVESVDRVRTEPPRREIRPEGVSSRMLAQVAASREENAQESDASLTRHLRVLCRSLSQLEHVLATGQKKIYVEFHDIREYRQAVAEAHSASAEIFITTLRIQKAGEVGLFRALAKHGADGWLVRNLAALRFAVEQGIPCAADFSLNVTNPLTAEWLIDQGAQRITASYDLNRDQLLELVGPLPPKWIEVVVHQHMPMFHMEHCVFCTVLSPGTNKSNCGRPCDRHDVRLRDRIGIEHVLHADIGCRNTLYNGNAQSGAEVVPVLSKLGVRDFRIEILRDAPRAEIERLVHLYRELVDGRLDGSAVWRSLKAENRVGVTRGTLEHPRNPLAIL
ncbi:MAG: U32 family peptidase [Pirellula sp.]|jgi:putative protease|nr:U32 family peptidase [Pirellula sp.]